MKFLIIVFTVVLLAILIIAIWISKRQDNQKIAQIDRLTDNLKKFSSKLEPKTLNLTKTVNSNGIFGTYKNESLLDEDDNDSANPLKWIPVKPYETEAKVEDIFEVSSTSDSSLNFKEVKTNDYLDLPGANQEFNVHDDFTSSILLVDDSITVLKFTGKLLTKNNYEVVTKIDGWEALTYLQNTKNTLPDVIISDIEMPNMDGIELINKIRLDKRFNHIPVLIISASAEKHLDLMEKGLIQGFLHKPYKEDNLLEQLKYVLLNN